MEKFTLTNGDRIGVVKHHSMAHRLKEDITEECPLKSQNGMS